MSTELARLDLRLRRRMLIGTAVGAAAYLLVVVAAYPAFKDDTSLSDMLQSNPAAAAAFGINGSITSPAGWLNANMYANFGPLLALMLTIGYGATAIAGQAGDGLLGLTATQPVTRGALLRQKTFALALTAVVVPVVSYAVCLAGPQFDLTPDWAHLAAVTVSTSLLAFDFGAVALLVGALTGSKGAALGVASGLAAAAYLVSSLAPTIDVVHRFRWASPFYWAVGDGQITTGVTWADLLVLVAIAGILTAAPLPSFRRLDIP
ncbi:MAG: ABC transporter permease subunit [Tetrasphaera sp.]